MRFFKCTTNKGAPILSLEPWEAEEMRTHPDYIEVDEHGDFVPDPKADYPNRIPLQGNMPAAVVAPKKRPILGLPKRK
jgi:hypothetical protein